MSWLDDYNPHTTIEVDNLWDAQLGIAALSLSMWTDKCGLLTCLTSAGHITLGLVLR